MVSGKHFHYEIGYDEHGLTVTVIHKPTGRRRLDHAKQGEDAPALQRRLVRDLLYAFYDEKDFACCVGRCSVDGRSGDFHSVEHVPTKRSKSLNTITSPDVKNPHETLLDSLVEELWREGLLPKVEGSAELL